MLHIHGRIVHARIHIFRSWARSAAVGVHKLGKYQFLEGSEAHICACILSEITFATTPQTVAQTQPDADTDYLVPILTAISVDIASSFCVNGDV